MAHDPQWLYIGRRTLMARLLALESWLRNFGR